MPDFHQKKHFSYIESAFCHPSVAESVEMYWSRILSLSCGFDPGKVVLLPISKLAYISNAKNTTEQMMKIFFLGFITGYVQIYGVHSRC